MKTRNLSTAFFVLGFILFAFQVQAKLHTSLDEPNLSTGEQSFLLSREEARALKICFGKMSSNECENAMSGFNSAQKKQIQLAEASMITLPGYLEKPSVLLPGLMLIVPAGSNYELIQMDWFERDLMQCLVDEGIIPRAVEVISREAGVTIPIVNQELINVPSVNALDRLARFDFCYQRTRSPYRVGSAKNDFKLSDLKMFGLDRCSGDLYKRCSGVSAGDEVSCLIDNKSVLAPQCGAVLGLASPDTSNIQTAEGGSEGAARTGRRQQL